MRCLGLCSAPLSRRFKSKLRNLAPATIPIRPLYFNGCSDIISSSISGTAFPKAYGSEQRRVLISLEDPSKGPFVFGNSQLNGGVNRSMTKNQPVSSHPLGDWGDWQNSTVVECNGEILVIDAGVMFLVRTCLASI